MSRVQYGEKGDFVNQPFAVKQIVEEKNQVKVVLERKGHVWTGHMRTPVTVEKSYSFSSASQSAVVSYTLTNGGVEAVDLWFAPEFNFNFLAPDAADRYYFDPPSGSHLSLPALSSQGEVSGLSSIGIADDWLGVKLILAFSQQCDLWRFPIYTVSNSEYGFERVCQGSCLLPNWKIQLGSGASWSVNLDLSIKKL